MFNFQLLGTLKNNVFQDNDVATNLKNKLIQIIDASKKSDENIHTVDNNGEVLNDLLDNTPLSRPTIIVDEQSELNLHDSQEELGKETHTRDSVGVVASCQTDGTVKTCTDVMV